jgi:hypothetical protein
MVAKAQRRGCPWLIYRAEEPWPSSCGDGLVSFSVVFMVGVGPIGGVWPSCGPFAGGVNPPCIVCSLLFGRLSM